MKLMPLTSTWAVHKELLEKDIMGLSYLSSLKSLKA